METILQIPCGRCGQVCAVTYYPDTLITEEFMRKCFTCSSCVSKQQRSPKPKVVKKAVQASLPYKD